MPFPREFREDVVRVARSREPGQTLKQIAADLGESCLANWLLLADRQEGSGPAQASGSWPSCGTRRSGSGCWWSVTAWSGTGQRC